MCNTDKAICMKRQLCVLLHGGGSMSVFSEL